MSLQQSQQQHRSFLHYTLDPVDPRIQAVVETEGGRGGGLSLYKASQCRAVFPNPLYQALVVATRDYMRSSVVYMYKQQQLMGPRALPTSRLLNGNAGMHSDSGQVSFEQRYNGDTDSSGLRVALEAIATGIPQCQLRAFYDHALGTTLHDVFTLRAVAWEYPCRKCKICPATVGAEYSGDKWLCWSCAVQVKRTDETLHGARSFSALCPEVSVQAGTHCSKFALDSYKLVPNHRPPPVSDGVVLRLYSEEAPSPVAAREFAHVDFLTATAIACQELMEIDSPDDLRDPAADGCETDGVCPVCGVYAAVFRVYPCMHNLACAYCYANKIVYAETTGVAGVDAAPVAAVAPAAAPVAALAAAASAGDAERYSADPFRLVACPRCELPFSTVVYEHRIKLRVVEGRVAVTKLPRNQVVRRSVVVHLPLRKHLGYSVGMPANPWGWVRTLALLHWLENPHENEYPFRSTVEPAWPEFQWLAGTLVWTRCPVPFLSCDGSVTVPLALASSEIVVGCSPARYAHLVALTNAIVARYSAYNDTEKRRARTVPMQDLVKEMGSAWINSMIQFLTGMRGKDRAAAALAFGLALTAAARSLPTSTTDALRKYAYPGLVFDAYYSEAMTSLQDACGANGNRERVTYRKDGGHISEVHLGPDAPMPVSLRAPSPGAMPDAMPWHDRWGPAEALLPTSDPMQRPRLLRAARPDGFWSCSRTIHWVRAAGLFVVYEGNWPDGMTVGNVGDSQRHMEACEKAMRIVEQCLVVIVPEMRGILEYMYDAREVPKPAPPPDGDKRCRLAERALALADAVKTAVVELQYSWFGPEGERRAPGGSYSKRARIEGTSPPLEMLEFLEGPGCAGGEYRLEDPNKLWAVVNEYTGVDVTRFGANPARALDCAAKYGSYARLLDAAFKHGTRIASRGGGDAAGGLGSRSSERGTGESSSDEDEPTTGWEEEEEEDEEEGRTPSKNK